MHKLLMLAALLGGCAAEGMDEEVDETDPPVVIDPSEPALPPGPQMSVTYYLDPRPECAGTPWRWDRVQEGLALWQEVGVSVTAADARQDGVSRWESVRVCFDTELKLGGQVTQQPDDMYLQIGVASSYYSLAAAHEMGHVVLWRTGLPQHPPAGVEGIMAKRLGWPHLRFSDDDLEFIALAGLYVTDEERE